MDWFGYRTRNSRTLPPIIATKGLFGLFNASPKNFNSFSIKKPDTAGKYAAKELSRLLGKEVKLAEDIVGQSAKELANNLNEGEAMLLIGKRTIPISISLTFIF